MDEFGLMARLFKASTLEVNACPLPRRSVGCISDGWY